MSPFNVIKHIASRTELKHTGKTKSGQDQYMGKCLAHDDNTASLAVCYTDNGGIGVYCHKGCSEGEICDSLDLKPSDLLPPSRNGNGKPNYEAVYSYVDEQGVELFQKIRKPGKKFSQRRKGNGEWVYKLGDVRKVLYRLDEITKAGANDLVFVVEGEKDADNFRKIGLVATCNPEGAATSNQRQKWLPE